MKKKSYITIFLLLFALLFAGCDARREEEPKRAQTEHTTPAGSSSEEIDPQWLEENMPPELQSKNILGGYFGPTFMEERNHFIAAYHGTPMELDFERDSPRGIPGLTRQVTWIFVDGIPVPMTWENGETKTFVPLDYPVLNERLHDTVRFEPLTGKKGERLAVFIPWISNAFLDFPPGNPYFSSMIGREGMVAPSVFKGIVMEADAKEGDLTFRQETAKAQAITKELKIKYFIDEDALEKMTDKEIDAMVIQGPGAQLRMNDASANVLQKPEDYTKNTWELALVGPDTIYGEGNFRLSLLKNYEQIPFGDCDYIDVKLEANKLTLVPIHFPDIEYKDKDILRIMVAPRDTIPNIFEENPSIMGYEWPKVFASWVLYTWTGDIPEYMRSGSE